MIVGDFNGNHQLWSLPHTQSNTTGKALADVLQNYQNISLNSPSGLATYINPATGAQSVLDLCFSSANLMSDVDIKIGPCLGSDHLPLLITVLTRPYIQTVTTRKRYKLTHVKWDEWSRGLPDLEWNESESLSYNNTNFVNSIKSSTYNIPQTSGKYNPKYNKPCWDERCSELVAKRRIAKNRLKRCQSIENIQKLRTAENEAKNYIKLIKKTSWEKYASTLTSTSPITDIWKQIKFIRNTYKTPDTAIDENNNVYTDPSKIADIFSSYFASKFNVPYNNPKLNDMYFNVQSSVIDNSIKDYNCEFTMNELTQALSHLRNTSPGQDDVENYFLKNLPGNYLDFLIKLINRSWLNEEVLNDWKLALVVPILKPKKNPLKTDSYRTYIHALLHWQTHRENDKQ